MSGLATIILTAMWTGSSAGDFAIPRAFYHLLLSQFA